MINNQVRENQSQDVVQKIITIYIIKAKKKSKSITITC